MENNKHKNDWFIANISSPNKTLGDFFQEGLNNENIQLLDRNAYKNNEQIKSIFTNQDGKFSEEDFNDFYDLSLQTYNSFTKENYDKTVMNDVYFDKDNIFVDKPVKRLQQPFTFNKRRNPLGQKQGVFGLTSKTDSTFTLREIAQTQKFFDTLTGTWKETSPNELGFWNTSLKDTLVLAQWDEDGTHYDEELGKELNHKKGDLKFNPEGKPYYETLGQREPYGKDVLSPWDVLTVDGSTADKWNYMSSDDKDKTITGSIMKAATYIAPYFIPGVGQYYTALTLGNAIATDLIPTLTKAGMGLLLNDLAEQSSLYKQMNKLQAFNAKWTPSTSDNAKQSLFNVENISMMITDIFSQLAQQRAIAKIPTWLSMNKKEIEAFNMATKGKSKEELLKLSADFKKIKDLNSKNAFLRTHFGGDQKIADMLSKIDLWNSKAGKALGIAYMAGISATQIHEESKLHGLNERDSAMMFLGLMAGYGALMQMDYMQWALKGIGLDDVEKAARDTIRNSTKALEPVTQKTLNLLGKDVVEETSQKAPTWWFKTYQNIGKKITNLLEEEDFASITSKMTAEAFEEMTEESASDALKGIYNGLRELNLVSTDSELTTPFEFDDLLARYAMAGIGGSFGGLIAGFQDKLAGHVNSSLPQGLKREIVSMMIHGYEHELRAKLKDMHKKGKLGNTKLSAMPEEVKINLGGDKVFKPADNQNISQNDLMYELLNAQINFVKKVIFQEGGAKLQYAKNYELRETMLINAELATPIQDDIQELVEKIIDLEGKKKTLEGVFNDDTKKEEASKNEDIAPIEEEINKYRSELQEILEGKKNTYYTGLGLFATQEGLYKAYKIHDKQSMSQQMFKKNYDVLRDEEQKKVDEAYAIYEKEAKRRVSKDAFAVFTKDTEMVNAALPMLNTYALQKKSIANSPNPELFFQYLQLYTAEENMDTVAQDYSDSVEINLRDETLTGIKSVEETGYYSLEKIVDAYLDFISKEQFVNPETKDFLDKIFDKAIVPQYTIINEDGSGKALNSLKDIVNQVLNEEVSKLISEIELDEDSFNNLNEILESVGLSPVLNNPLKLNNLNKFITDISDINILFNKDINKDFDSSDPEIKNRIVEMLSKVSGRIQQILLNKNTINQDGNFQIEIFEDGEDNPFLIAQKYEEVQKAYEGKELSPIHSLISNFASLEGKDSIVNLFNALNSAYNELTNNKLANEFILQENIDKQQLEYAKFIMDRLKANLLASVDFESLTQDPNNIIGYNSALNKTEQLNLPTLDPQNYMSLIDIIETLEMKIDFLIKFSEYNSGGTIREAKQIQSRVITLQLRGLSAHLEALKNVGLDTKEIEVLFDNSKRYQENIAIIESEGDNVVPYDDVALIELRKEKDAIEKALYLLWNKSENKKSILEKYLSTVEIPLIEIDNPLTLNSTVKTISKFDEVSYLLETLTIHPKQFYLDYYDDLNNDTVEHYYDKVPQSPFYGQELVAKRAYWSIMSKFSDVDTYSIFLDKVLPKYVDSIKNRNPFYDNREVWTSLLNSIFINGVPGAGKSSVVFKFLSNVLNKYESLNVALFAPHKAQVQILEKNSALINNYINKDNNLILDLVKAIDPNLATLIVDQIAKDANEWTDKDVLKIKDSVEGDSSKHNRDVPLLNMDNESVQNFYKNFKSLVINGKIPNVIFIDEATHMNLGFLQLLNEAVKIHNNNHIRPDEKISVVYMGDYKQSGAVYTKNGKKRIFGLYSTNVVSTSQLTQSFRSGNNLVLDNIRLFEATSDAIEYALVKKTFEKSADLQFKFKYQDEDLYGHKVVDEFTNYDEILNLVKKSKGSFALITDKVESPVITLLKNNFNTEDYQILSINEVQGQEFDYAVIDLTNGERIPSIDNFKINSSDLYTAISRVKKGSIITSKAFPSAYYKVSTTDENLLIKNLTLDEKLLTRYKKALREQIKQSLKKLGPLTDAELFRDLKGSKKGDQPEDTSDELEALYNLISEQLDKDYVETGPYMVVRDEERKNISDTDVPLIYSFHERLGIAIGENEIKVEDYNADLPLLYNLINDTDISKDILSKEDELNNYRIKLKALKNTVLNYYTDNLNINNPNLKTTLEQIINLRAVAEKLNPDDFELLVMTKEYDPLYDTPYDKTLHSKAKKGGYISYLMWVDTNSFDEKSGDFTKKFTLAALPNINNDKVPPLVLEQLNLLQENHKKTNEKKSYFKLKDISKLKRVSNLLIDKDKKYESYGEFLIDHNHLTISEPYVIINDSLLKADPTNKDHDEKVVENLGKLSKKNLQGRAFVLVSDDLTLKPDELLIKFREQVKKAKLYKAGDTKNGAPSKNNIRLILLNPTTNKFSDWILKNQEILAKSYQKLDTSKQEFRALHNNYAAAKMIARMLTVLDSYYYYVKNNYTGNLYLPSEITHSKLDNGSFQFNKSKLEKFIQQIEDVLYVALPATTGMSDIDLISRFSQQLNLKLNIPTNEDGSIKSLTKQQRIDLHNEFNELLLKSRNSADVIFKLEKKALPPNSPVPVMKELFYSKELLKIMNDVGLKPQDELNKQNVSIVDSRLEALKTDIEKKSNRLSKAEKNVALDNMVAAMRVAFYGGKIKLPNDKTTRYMPSIFGPEISNAERDAFLSKLDLIFVGEPKHIATKKGNNDYVYKPLFPDGIHMDIYLQAKELGGARTPQETFGIPYANNQEHVKVNVGVEEAKFTLDLKELDYENAITGKIIKNPLQEKFRSVLRETHQKAVSLVNKESLFFNSKTINKTLLEDLSDLLKQHNAILEDTLKREGLETETDMKEFLEDSYNSLLELYLKRGLFSKLDQFVPYEIMDAIDVNLGILKKVKLDDYMKSIIDGFKLNNPQIGLITPHYTFMNTDIINISNSVNNMPLFNYNVKTKELTNLVPQDIMTMINDTKIIFAELKNLKPVIKDLDKYEIALINAINKNTLLPNEQKELGELYLKLRLASSVDPKLTLKIKNLFKKITDSKIC